GYVVHLRQQVAQPGAAVVAVVELVAVDRLADQRDLLAPLAGQLPDLGQHVLRRPALLRPAGARDHAVGAELVAPELDPDERTEGGRPHRRVAGRVEADEAGFDLVPAGVGPAEAQGVLRLA